MTRSFTSMLLGLQYLGATASRNRAFCDSLMRLPEQVLRLLEQVPARLERFVQSHTYDDYVFLAQGPLFAIANEAMLKVMESSCSHAQVFHSLEFRHGPKAIAGPDALISFFLSDSSYESEIDVLKEMKRLGAHILAVCNDGNGAINKDADFLVELRLDVPEDARLAAHVIWGQLLAVYTGLKKGLNPDAPRNLSRVVILDGQC